MKLTEQSELKMESRSHRRAYECSTTSRERKASLQRVSQASWWFGQMRRAVEHACPAERRPARRVEQRVLPLGAQ
jgi:hypothetical protein